MRGLGGIKMKIRIKMKRKIRNRNGMEYTD
jgi:hypothetical protein